MLHLCCSLCRRHLCNIDFISVPSVPLCAILFNSFSRIVRHLTACTQRITFTKRNVFFGKINISFHESKALFSRKQLRECCYRQATVRPAMTMLTILMSLIRMLSDGPEVSLNGSPTIVIIYALELCNTIISQ